jgi:hypothetical protein
MFFGVLCSDLGFESHVVMIQLGRILMCKLLKSFVFLVVYFLRFTPRCISEIVAALDEVEKDPQAAALVTTGEGRFYSNGLSLSLVNKTSRENLVSSFHVIHHPTLFSILDRKFCL